MQDSAPAFRLILLRHARSGWALPGQRDFDRTLDETGYAEAELIAQGAADHGLCPDLVLCSTAVRCRQTAEPFRRALGEDIDIRYVDQLYAGPAAVYTDLIKIHADRTCLMVVGHNPMIEDVFRSYLGEQQSATALENGYPPAGLAVIDFSARSSAGRISAAALSTLLLPKPEEVVRR
ncbi:histidine phosphatase family protein [Sinorhizobium sp. CCBAU 05631]|uniref:SixA phosphatase family protein n=1 Tax=Sinorhizobium sp. CCBAU 05631 TaxID=794846 RepID=UPI0004B197A8|nr:histidine phosphatase family protein [Sinorhizobium sp. CCBAU 05631]ASY56746.1 Phosphohistidine phosphatase SixA [Sinorhizobium sp. CCBAU 05631]